MARINRKKTVKYRKTKPAKSFEGRIRKKDPRYNSQKWKNTRDSVLIRDNFLCQECLRNGIHTALRVKLHDYAIDHIKQAFKVSDFFDKSNLEALCQKCHNTKSGSERL